MEFAPETAAGRADYRQKVISLNPRLLEHPAEIDRTLRHELAHSRSISCGAAPDSPPWRGVAAGLQRFENRR
jgi:SprT-like family.